MIALHTGLIIFQSSIIHGTMMRNAELLGGKWVEAPAHHLPTTHATLTLSTLPPMPTVPTLPSTLDAALISLTVYLLVDYTNFAHFSLFG